MRSLYRRAVTNSVIDVKRNVTQPSVGQLQSFAANLQTIKQKRASPNTITRTSLKNMRKPSFAAMTAQREEPTHLASQKSVNPLRMTHRPSPLIGTSPCITRYANLFLTTKKPDTAITIRPIGKQQNKEKAPAASVQRLTLKCFLWPISGIYTF